jgi:hypothetical protein
MIFTFHRSPSVMTSTPASVCRRSTAANRLADQPRIGVTVVGLTAVLRRQDRG